MMLASPSFAEWTKVGENVDGTFYLDFERIQKIDGYIYWWELRDFSKPDKSGILSAKGYIQGDCKLFRYKNLKLFGHEEPMGGGSGETVTPPDKWKYSTPNSANYIILKNICKIAN